MDLGDVSVKRFGNDKDFLRLSWNRDFLKISGFLPPQKKLENFSKNEIIFSSGSYFENNEYSLEYMMNLKIRNKEEFSCFEINDFLK